MIKKFALSTAVAVSALTAIPSAASAQNGYGYYETRGNGYNNQYRRNDNRYDQRYSQRYDRRYANQRYSNQRYGNYYGNRCRRDSGSTGTILGAIAGGLLGREIAGRGDRTVGTIIGGAAGALDRPRGRPRRQLPPLVR